MKDVKRDQVIKYLTAISRHGSQALVKDVKVGFYNRGIKVVVNLATSNFNDFTHEFIAAALKKVEYKWNWPAFGKPDFQITRHDRCLKIVYLVSFDRI